MGTMTHGVEVVMYHYVRPIDRTAFPRIRGLHTDGFERQLDWLQENTRIIGIDEFLALLAAGTAPSERTSLLTFDDGFRDHVDFVLPALERRGLTGAFYVPSAAVLEAELLDVHRIQFILASIDESDVETLIARCRDAIASYLPPQRMGELQAESRKSRFDTENVIVLKRLLQRELPRAVRRALTAELFADYVSTDEAAFSRELYLNESDLRHLVDAGMHVGSHAHSHEWLPFLPAAEQEMELRRSHELLDSIGAGSEWTLAYPYGHFDPSTLDIAHRLHCAAAFTTRVGPVNIGAGDFDSMSRLELPRYDTNDFPQ